LGEAGAMAGELAGLGAQVTALGRSSSCTLTRMCRLPGAVRAAGPDVVNLHLEAATLAGLALKRRSGQAQYVVTIHALKRQLPWWFYPAFGRLARRADAIVVEDRISFAEVASVGYPAERIHHIPIGTDFGARAEPAAGGADAIRREFGLAREWPVVLNIARMTRTKGQAHLIEALAQMKEEIPDVRLVIVGGGKEERALKGLAARRGLADRVVFAGTRRDLDAFYQAADAFAVTALDEGMGVVVYQAMAMGVPVVAYDAGSIGEAIRHNETGFLVPCGDTAALAKQLAAVLQNAGGRCRGVVAAARQRIETEFSAETMTRRYEEVYRHLVERV